VSVEEDGVGGGLARVPGPSEGAGAGAAPSSDGEGTGGVVCAYAEQTSDVSPAKTTNEENECAMKFPSDEAARRAGMV
jgi:hypothetical protein